MITLKTSTDTIGGPVTIARVAGKSAQTGLVPYLLFLAIVSISLGILNLLHIPLLDGGQLVYLLLERIRGEPLCRRGQPFARREAGRMARGLHHRPRAASTSAEPRSAQ